MMPHYLQIFYILGPEAGTHDHVGPFESVLAAGAHMFNYGPVNAQIVEYNRQPDPCMSPQEHIKHVENRM